MNPIVNGVPFPNSVNDLDELQKWIASIDRPFRESIGPFAGIDIFGQRIAHIERYFFVPFFEGITEDKVNALALCCQWLSAQMYWDFIQVPKGTIVMRVVPEADVQRVTGIRHDLTIMKTRKQLEPPNYKGPPISLEELRPDKSWSVDFLTDVLFKRAENTENLRLMKIYARYCCAVFPKED